MTSWQSPSIPSYIDSDLFLEQVYNTFYNSAPHKSGTMRNGIDYIQTGSSSYWWDDVIYAGYQNNLIGKDGHKGAYYGWWDELSDTFNHTLQYYEGLSKMKVPDWFNSIIDSYL